MEDIYNFMSKPILVTLHRQRYRHHVKTFSGVLCECNKSTVCLRKKNGKRVWIPRPRFFRDTIMEIV